jgi:hypothetical protein
MDSSLYNYRNGLSMIKEFHQHLGTEIKRFLKRNLNLIEDLQDLYKLFEKNRNIKLKICTVT